MYFVYILQSLKNKKYYVGCTSDLEQRVKQHNRGDNKSTKFSIPWTIVSYRLFNNQQEAYGYEKLVKSYKGGNGFKKIIKQKTKEWVFK